MCNKKIQATMIAVMLGLAAGQGYAYDGRHGRKPVEVVLVEPQVYQCHGRGASVVFQVASPNYPAMMNLTWTTKGSIKSEYYHAEGEDISSATTVFGEVLNVTLKSESNKPSVKVSIILPEIYLGPPLREEQFDGQLVVTSVASPPAGEPFEGVANPSKYIDVDCRANLNEF